MRKPYSGLWISHRNRCTASSRVTATRAIARGRRPNQPKTSAADIPKKMIAIMAAAPRSLSPRLTRLYVGGYGRFAEREGRPCCAAEALVSGDRQQGLHEQQDLPHDRAARPVVGVARAGAGSDHR